MTTTEHERKFYEKALATASTGAASTGYGMPINQQVRFDVLRRYLPQHDDYSLLDVGCGTGDLLRQTKLWGNTPRRYVGIDPMQEMVAQAEKEYEYLRNLDPDMMLRFERTTALDWQKWPFEWFPDGSFSFDYVVSVAALAFADPDDGMEQRLKFVQDNVAAMAALAREKVVVTLFSTWKNRPLPEELSVDPAAMFTWARQRWQRVELIHSYCPFDFTLVIDKTEGEWWTEWEKAQAAKSSD